MRIAADIPNPNQSNVYYSVAALGSELLNYFSKEKVDSIKKTMESYYLPTFVFDPAGAPVVYNLDVYPKNKSKESYQIDEQGNIVDEIVNPTPAVKPPSEMELRDGGHRCQLDPKFHSSTLLKEPNEIDLPIDTGVLPSLDLLLATKFSGDEDKLETRMQNFSILKNILLETMKSLPSEELEAIKKNFIDTVESIEGFKETLAEINEGQTNSLTGLQFGSFVNEVYSVVGSPTYDRKGFDGTRMILAQALADLAHSVFQPTTGSPYLYAGSNRLQVKMGETNKKITAEGFSTVNSNSGTSIWPHFLGKLRDMGLLETIDLDIPRTSQNFDLLEGDLQSLLYYGAEGASSNEVYSLEGRPKEWYYDNFVATIKGEDTNWDALHNYLRTFDQTTEPYIQKATQDTLGGSNLLVDQAIMKAMLDLCMTNLDVSEFAPRVGQEAPTEPSTGNNYFSEIQRSGALGPSGTTPYPSKQVIDPEDYQVKPYTNSSFLCYYALIQIVRSISEQSSKDFLLHNLTKFESNHDEVVDLITDVHYFTSLTGSTSTMDPKPDSGIPGVGAQFPIKSRNLQELLHAYKRFENFPVSDDVLLIGDEDNRVPAQERTFFTFNVPRLKHTTEAALEVLPEVDTSPYYRLNSDNDFAVTGSGKLNLNALPDEYGYMGFIGNEEATTNMRTYKIHYGYTDQTNAKDVKEFYKQRRYSMPYFWASMTSLWRALTVKSWKNLIESINDIAETEIEMTKEEILATFDHSKLWYRIRQIIFELEKQNDIKFRIYVGSDGSLNLLENNSLAASTAYRQEYRNTPGQSTKKMLQGWVRFVSLVSNHSSLQTVESLEPLEFDYQTYLASEAMALETNQNFANNHGGSNQYISAVFSPYFDKLEVIPKEFKDQLPIKKSESPVGASVTWYQESFSGFLSRSHNLHKHVGMFEHVKASFRNMETFVKGFDMPESVKPVFLEGEIDIRKEIQDPAGLIDQIVDNQRRYAPNEFGLGGRWNWSLDTKSLVTASTNEGWVYIHILGLDKSLWQNTETIKVMPEYIGSSALVPIVGAQVSVDYGYDPENESDKKSDALLRYIHLDRGLDVNELTFSSKTKLIYSEALTDSESGIFPWSKDDFKEGMAKKPVETLFNMSPWLFPKNYFYDICLQNKYHRVIACVITEEALAEAGIGVIEEDGAVEDIVGSIRWKVV